MCLLLAELKGFPINALVPLLSSRTLILAPLVSGAMKYSTARTNNASFTPLHLHRPGGLPDACLTDSPSVRRQPPLIAPSTARPLMGADSGLWQEGSAVTHRHSPTNAPHAGSPTRSG